MSPSPDSTAQNGATAAEQAVSDCCLAPVRVGGEGTTHYHVCTKCGHACAALAETRGNRGGPPLGREPLDEATDSFGRARTPAEPFSHSRSLAGQEAELWPGDEQDDAQYEWELREEILGWRP